MRPAPRRSPRPAFRLRTARNAENIKTSADVTFLTRTKAESLAEVTRAAGARSGFDHGNTTSNSVTLPCHADACTVTSRGSVGCLPFQAFSQSNAYKGVYGGFVSSQPDRSNPVALESISTSISGPAVESPV